ncbi:formate dehydrogenase accessory sulfurtransferase FdhD [Chitinophaga silvatica]|uniref:Sulfur carrier protein FdhD n=1 Tax=Chitinophaga silvatica TaxID=2282649 RepID=A0A3E1Y3N1_9BACT|nr:formate dehydrogenase accessory sulfurtransferase FdhD [Chitinophaga silvatica]RFS19087.1 formate dehydrogenase accessory sulfurtransferase FdhD [Chitinophaga silvatica]
MINAVVSTHVMKVAQNGITETDDVLATEAPLQIQLMYENITQQISVTMRTPGSDSSLATGFLFTEGIISSYKEIEFVELTETPEGSIATVHLSATSQPQLKQINRSFVSTAACGVCGKTSMEDIHTAISKINTTTTFHAEELFRLPETLHQQQALFNTTGGLHAAGLFSAKGELLILEEDIGRHNAVDKVIGSAIKEPAIDRSTCLLLLSGRAGFELIQKAAMAGIPFIASIGAPSSMAVDMATKYNITLIGFLKAQRFNIYSLPERIICK